ncbi:M3 family metallopeptidase [Candidatus Pelagadaptatus aseana]|uniref:M3 family metallopeptidase n=1 Tax=Candidatus Pelagadaptatus aseana TaxID=3120508 RepID=UPI003C700B0C
MKTIHKIFAAALMLSAVTVSAANLEQVTAESFTAECNSSVATITVQLRQLEAFAGTPDKQTFLRPLDEVMLNLADAAKRANLYQSVHPDQSLRQAAEQCSQDLDKLNTDINLSQPLFEVLSRLDRSPLSSVDNYLVETLLRDFKLAGVNLADDQRDQVRALQQELVKVGQNFNRTIREDVRHLELHSTSQLKGLPADYIAAHQPGEDGVIRLSTRYPDYIPFVTYAEDESLREAFYRMARSRGYPDNRDHLQQLIQKRHQLAGLLGFDSHADRITADKMIGSAEAAARFIDKVSLAAEPAAQRDKAQLLQRLQQQRPEATQVQRWQLSYLQDKIKTEQYQVDAKQLRNYFAYGRVKSGIFELVESMFDVQFKPWDAQVWHPSVEAWEMWGDDQLLGRFYLDMHPRDGKYQHAAMFPTRTGVAGRQVPVATLVCNFPGEGNPTEKMEFTQVKTFLHEFGHLLHELFAGRNQWVAQSGISTEWDFVEAPSQMLEEWVYDKTTLQSLAVNDAGESLSDDVVTRLQAARNFNRGVGTQIQMFYSALSLNYYRHNPEQLDLYQLMLDLEQQYSPLPPVEGTHFYANFGHLNGYSAIYYTYMWSQVIALDMFSRFETEGLLNPETAKAYRQLVLEPGGSKPAATLVRDFLGRDFSFDSFARRLNSH